MKRLLLAMAAMILAGSVTGIAIASYEVITMEQELPEWSGVDDYHPPVVTKVYDKNGELMAKFYKERRTVIPQEKLPELLKKAFMAAEDGNFYEHTGVDFKGIVAAMVQEVRRKFFHGSQRGGSTITMQLAKTFLIANDSSLLRGIKYKVKQMLLARRIERVLSKDEILFLYLNQIYFGNEAYGVEEASLTYFGKHVGQLTLAEYATLASLVKAPSKINPVNNPKRTLERRAYVLGQMEKHGFATSKEVAVAMKEPLPVARATSEFLNKAPYAAGEILKYLIEKYGEDAVYKQGLIVNVAIDARASVAGQQAFTDGIAEVDKRMGYRGPLARLTKTELDEFLTVARAELNERLPEDTRESYVWDMSWIKPNAFMANGAADQIRFVKRDIGTLATGVVTGIMDSENSVVLDLGSGPASMAMADMKWARAAGETGVGPVPKRPSEVLAIGDIVLVKINRENDGVPEVSLEQIPKVQGALVSIETDTRRITALVGGSNFERTNYNRATLATRQPGSSFKPFIYAEAIASRKFTAATIIDDSPKVFFDEVTGKDWTPTNSTGGTFRGNIRLRECLTHSINMCSIELVETLKLDAVMEAAHRVGLGKGWQKVMSLALGTGEVTPLKLCNAYATFADAGQYAEPILVTKVRRLDGTVLEESAVEKRQVMDPAVAYVTLSMMKSVVEQGTAHRVKELKRPVAGKTGTSTVRRDASPDAPVETRDAWFVGCVPGLCTAVYVGMDGAGTLGKEEAGGRASAPIWLAYNKAVLEGTPVRDFPEPEGIARYTINSKTGELAEPDSEDAMEEVFLEGTGPGAVEAEAHD